ncbi:hypothetical protein QYF36_004382 [Acer negundo]|nr:hypothetical protein QYF36_004382 [Acer negundo]
MSLFLSFGVLWMKVVLRGLSSLSPFANTKVRSKRKEGKDACSKPCASGPKMGCERISGRWGKCGLWVGRLEGGLLWQSD